MAAITITAADVKLTLGPIIQSLATFGEAVTQGQPVRLDTSDTKHYLCKNDVEAEAAAEHLALTPGGDADLGVLVGQGAKVYLGAATGMVVGDSYYVGPNDGEIVPEADLLTGDYVTRVGICVAAGVLEVDINATGVLVP